MAYRRHRGVSVVIREAIRTDLRAAIWECRIRRGMSAQETADFLQVPVGRVYTELRAVVAEAQENIFDDIVRFKIEQHHRLEHLYNESVGAWEESKLDRVKTTSTSYKKSASDDNKDGRLIDANVPDQIATVHEAQVGDPRFLSTAQAALNAIEKLWNLSSPEGQDFSKQAKIVDSDANELDAIRAAEDMFRQRKYLQDGNSGDLQTESGAVVPEVRLDHGHGEGEKDSL